ncbi:Nif3-like dinuclear metal center hexameric protein [Methanobrevibacter sp.]|uniref:Nif3-like dinuclear metal center hexameric protein n=1 Tax=Methanobrevibacter sp. TaxID=66852 RepID=UPI00388DA2A6
MKLNDIIEFLNKKIPQNLALDGDNVGLMGDYDLTLDINKIKILMDLYPEDDVFDENTLIVTHHPPLFSPKSPTFTIHSNWDIIEGGANDALADSLNLKVIENFDKTTNIGRICKSNITFKELENLILTEFDYFNVVNKPDDDMMINDIGIISGFGLKNPEYIKLAKEYGLDMLISGDLTQETSILAINLELTLIDLGHHNSEVPGLYYLKDIIDDLNIDCEVINRIPMESKRK